MANRFPAALSSRLNLMYVESQDREYRRTLRSFAFLSPCAPLAAFEPCQGAFKAESVKPCCDIIHSCEKLCLSGLWQGRIVHLCTKPVYYCLCYVVCSVWPRPCGSTICINCWECSFPDSKAEYRTTSPTNRGGRPVPKPSDSTLQVRNGTHDDLSHCNVVLRNTLQCE